MLSVVITDCFGKQTAQMIQDEWISADGKVMRGTMKSGEKQAIIHAVSHECRIDVAQARQVKYKSSGKIYGLPRIFDFYAKAS